MNAEKHNLDRIYFGGGFIRGPSPPPLLPLPLLVALTDDPS